MLPSSELQQGLELSPLHPQCPLVLSEIRDLVKINFSTMTFFLRFLHDLKNMNRVMRNLGLVFLKDGPGNLKSNGRSIICRKDIASASGRFGASNTLQTRCSPLPFRNISLIVAAWASTCPPAGFFGSDINIPPPGSAITASNNPIIWFSNKLLVCY